MTIVKPLNRRTFLRGTGVALALPFLEAMLPINRSWAAEKPKFAFFYSGLGVTSDPNPVTLNIMHPNLRNMFAPYNDYATYITGLMNDGVTNNHNEIAGLMAGTAPGGYKRATSIDRVAADLLNSGTLFKDGLYLGTQSRASEQSAIFNCMSHKQGSQSTMYHDPRTVFNLITTLGGFASQAAPTVDPTKRDVLSLALSSIKSLKRELSSQDNTVLDKHLTAIEQIQKSMAGSGASPTCQAPTNVSTSYPDFRGDLKLPILADLAALAFNCDLTRTIAFMIFPDGAGSTFNHEFLYPSFEAKYGSRPGVGYHEWTHKRWLSPSNTSNGNTTRCRGAMLASDEWDVSVAARFLGAVDQQVLENGVVAFGSGGGYNGQHPSAAAGASTATHHNIPFVLFGKLGGAIKPKGPVAINHDGSVCNVWLTLLKSMGYQGDSFGTLREPTRLAALG